MIQYDETAHIYFFARPSHASEVLTARLKFRKGTIVGPLSVAAAMTSMAFALEDISGGDWYDTSERTGATI
jgi:hypothetical protein